MMRLTNSPIVFLMMVNLLLLAVGTFMEVNAAKVMLLPVLFPIAMKLGIDPVHFGVVVTVNLCIGLVTPPIGMVLALGCRIGGISLEKGTVAIFPFFVIALFVLVVLTFFPIFSIWLPNLLFG
jgi:C4-dicarboxylate transporter DctM subunit